MDLTIFYIQILHFRCTPNEDLNCRIDNLETPENLTS